MIVRLILALSPKIAVNALIGTANSYLFFLLQRICMISVIQGRCKYIESFIL